MYYYTKSLFYPLLYCPKFCNKKSFRGRIFTLSIPISFVGLTHDFSDLRIHELISGSFRHPDQWIVKIPFSIESFAFTSSVVPITSYLMVRSEFYNGAQNEIGSWVNLLSLYWLEALDFLFYCYKKILFSMVWMRIDALLHCLLWDYS